MDELTCHDGRYGATSIERAANESAFPGARKLLVIETLHTLEIVRRRDMEASVLCRDLDGFFKHVWSVHPVATLITSDAWTPRFGKPVWHRLAERHTFVEGKVGRFMALRRFAALNFLIAQIGLLFALYRLIRREGIGVIRAGDPLYTGLISWILARLTGIPFLIRVGTNHDKYYELLNEPIMPRLFRSQRLERVVARFVFSRADLVAGINDDNMAFAIANGARPERSTLFRLGNLLDPRHLADPRERESDACLLEKLGIESGRYILCIGRLVPVKQPDAVVRALGELVARGHDVKAVLAGDGPMATDLFDLAAELAVADRLVFPGDCGQGELATLIVHAGAVISPITGRALAEAALGAAPIAAYDVDWQAEFIETGVTGELVPFMDVQALACAIEKLLDDPDYARRMGDAARERALQMFDPECLNEHERQTYAGLLAQTAPSDRARRSASS